jgi:murein DD-endopeptidase MepM/ murein hydrolase activator NlpD
MKVWPLNSKTLENPASENAD